MTMTMTDDDRVDTGAGWPAWLGTAFACGAAAWPTIEVDVADLAAMFAAYFTARGQRVDDALPGVQPLAADAAELYLATACQRGRSRALATFRAHYYSPLEPMLGLMGLDAADRNDAWQILSTRLFVAAAGERPRIVNYAGRGQLHGLVKVAATRLAIDQLEQRANRDRNAGDTWLDQMTAAASDPELRLMKRQHRSELKEEVEAAIAELGTRERALLRLTVVERMGIDAIAAAYQTHRATVARWVIRAREQLAARIRARLTERWRMSEAELVEIRPLLDSQLELSLERLLRDR
jgi:RNA polymerase sigma-70 factor (ECF subfamily)